MIPPSMPVVPRTRVVHAGAAALLIGLLLVLIVPRSERPAAAQTTTDPRLTLVHQTPFLGPDGTFRAEVATTGLPTDTRLRLTVYQQVASRSRLDQAMSGQQLGTTVVSVPMTPVAAAGPTTVSLPVAAVWPAPADGAVLTIAGVYPVTIDAIRPDGTRIDRLVTQIVRLPAADVPTDALEVGTIVTVDAVPTVSDRVPSLSATDAISAADRMAIVDDATAPDLTLLAAPWVLDGLRERGSVLRPSTPRRQVLATPWVSIDAGSLLRGRQETTITDEHRVGTAALTSMLGTAPDRRVTVIDGTTTPRALDLAADRGARAVILDSAQVRSSLGTDDSTGITQQFVIRSENGTAFAAMASDDHTAAPFTFERDPVLAAHRALAQLAMLHFEQPGASRGVAVTLPAATSPIALREFLTGLTQRAGATSGSVGAPVVEPVTLDGLLASTAVTTDRSGPLVRDWTSDEPHDPGPWTTTLDQARWDLRGLQSLLPDGEEATAPVERAVLTAAARFLADTDRVAVLTEAESSIRGLAAGVTLPTTQRVTLTSRSGDIPLMLGNSLTTDAHVRVTVSSPKLDFPDGSTIDLVLPPGTTRATVHVETRASGAFPMQVTVSSADGVLFVASSRIDVRSTAISGWGLVLSIGAGLFLVGWWIRHFRHTRRARSLVDVDAPETGSTTPR